MTFRDRLVEHAVEIGADAVGVALVERMAGDAEAMVMSLPLAALAWASSGPIGSGPAGAAAVEVAASFDARDHIDRFHQLLRTAPALWPMMPVTIARIMAPRSAPRTLFISKDIDATLGLYSRHCSPGASLAAGNYAKFR